MSEQDVRARIISESTRLFAEQGFARTSIREIAEAVGVTKPALYYHFGSKEGLFTALIEHHVGDWIQAAEAVARGPGTVVERLRGYLDASFRRHLSDPMVSRFLIEALHQAGQGAPPVDALRFFAAETRIVHELIQEGVDVGELRPHDALTGAMALIGARNFHLGAAMVGGPPLTDDAPERILNLFLNGVSP